MCEGSLIRHQQLNGIYKVWDNSEVINLLSQRNVTNDEIDLALRHAATAYRFFCYSVKVWDQYNDELLKLRKGQRILRGGLQLSTDHMPQGDNLLIPLTSNIGYQTQSHVVVHYNDAGPDLGHKGFQPELKELGEDISVSIVGQLRKWRQYLKHDTGAAPSIDTDGNLYEWITKQEEHERTAPLRLSNKHLFSR